MHSDIDGIMDELDRDPFGTRTFPGFGLLSPMPVFPAIASSSFSSSAFGNSHGRGRWVSESFSSRAVNGVQESIHRRIDSDVSDVSYHIPDWVNPTTRATNTSLVLYKMVVKSAP